MGDLRVVRKIFPLEIIPTIQKRAFSEIRLLYINNKQAHPADDRGAQGQSHHRTAKSAPQSPGTLLLKLDEIWHPKEQCREVAMKRTHFEEILENEFRWPTPGDAPFTAVPDPDANATIPDDGIVRLVFMMEGYRKAADLMVARAEADPRDRNYLVCPIIFNYRQYIELSLKYMIAIFGRTVGLDAEWRTHDLATLWQTFAELLDRYGTTDPDLADEVVAEIIAEFAKIDPGSYSYRYPVDTKGRPLPIAYADLHLPKLADVMTGVAGYFTGSDGLLTDMQRAQS